MKKNIAYTLMLAEDVRAELGDKFTLVGLCPLALKLAKEDDKDHALHTIACYGEFIGIKEAHEAKIVVSSPSGEILAEGVVDIPQDKRDNLVIAGKFTNIKFKESGKHRLTIKIDEADFHKDFTILIAESQQ